MGAYSKYEFKSKKSNWMKRRTTSYSSLDIKTLKAAIDTVFPGAVKANVNNYIEGLLKSSDEESLKTYEEGLRDLNRLSWSYYETLFANLTVKNRMVILETIEETNFFEQLRQHTMEGMFADPIYGGNKDKIGWKLIGFPGARFHPITHLSSGWKASKFVSLEDKERLRENER
ncbi:gluconate 2-dehydrogenase subunit 3 family protein [Natranaerofaba carboxydovora]|uniref:gluconate 2-dehydrogenase subunit 3 family protein n=1 Tax=Natranaerofaba carboxydovora TaxID=2742683 RepID=UPI001F12B83E|nr:gluconate 2-dehydrogenase subunit 3 family protein [Natranaerofaba carboxydovora]UMZ72495.1 Gluconate 2-dehydrogenase subunit 3 [Natranaerofaba carboxydovora]